MENTFSTPDLRIDEQAGAYLMSAAKWNSFLSIIGFIACGLMVIGALFMMTFGAFMGGFYAGYPSGMGFAMGIAYLILAGLYVMPCIYLYMFASKMQQALRQGSQETLNTAFANFKSYSKYVGIMVIVCIGLSILSIMLIPLFAILGSSF